MSRANNPLEELAELFSVDPEEQSSGLGEALHYQLRFGETELVLEDGRICKVSIGRAFLGLSLSGLSIEPGSEYGAYLKPNDVTVTHTAEKQTRSSSGGRLNAKVGNLLGLGASADIELQSTTNQSEKAAYSLTKTRVTPRAGQKWEIVELDGKPLDQLYLAHSVALCRVRAKRGANLKEVSARVYVKQRDLIFRYDESNSILKMRLTPNKEKLLGILISKALNAKLPKGEHLYSGSLVLSEVVSEHEG